MSTNTGDCHLWCYQAGERELANKKTFWCWKTGTWCRIIENQIVTGAWRMEIQIVVHRCFVWILCWCLLSLGAIVLLASVELHESWQTRKQQPNNRNPNEKRIQRLRSEEAQEQHPVLPTNNTALVHCCNKYQLLRSFSWTTNAALTRLV